MSRVSVLAIQLLACVVRKCLITTGYVSLVVAPYRYTELWPDSAAVAEELASETKLSSVVADINSHHYAVASPNNPTPVWLKDQLLNQWSHFHMLMWYKDGRLREYEAWSCDDVDR